MSQLPIEGAANVYSNNNNRLAQMICSFGLLARDSRFVASPTTADQMYQSGRLRATWAPSRYANQADDDDLGADLLGPSRKSHKAPPAKPLAQGSAALGPGPSCAQFGAALRAASSFA